MIILVVTEAMLAVGAASFERIIAEAAYDEQFQARMKANAERAMKSLDDYALRRLEAHEGLKQSILRESAGVVGYIGRTCSLLDDVPALTLADLQPALDMLHPKSEPLNISMYCPADAKLEKPKVPQPKYAGYYKKANRKRY